MNDPIPVGFVTVRTAFQRYLSVFGGVDLDGRSFALLTAFANGDLQALTTNPVSHREDEIPADLWLEGAFPDRVFHDDDIAPSEEWRAYSGRTPYVSEDALSNWTTEQLVTQRRLVDQLRGQYWTVDQALNWLLWRDQNPNEVDIMVRLIASLEPGEAKPAVNFDSAKARLLLALRTGDVRAVATNVSTGGVEAIAETQFATAELQHSEQGHRVQFTARDGDAGLHGGHLNIPRLPADEVARAFPVVRAEYSSMRMRVHADRTTASNVDFDDAEKVLTLFRASQWLALKGKSGPISLEATEATAAGVLFPALTAGRLAAQAIDTSTMEPCTVPPSRWAVVTTDEGRPGQLLQWLNVWWLSKGPDTGDQIGGELTKHEDRAHSGGARPTWVQISVELADLKGLLQDKPARRRGAQPGQGAVDDTREIARVYELMKSGMKRWKATQVVGAEIGIGDDGLAARTAARLWRKTNDA